MNYCYMMNIREDSGEGITLKFDSWDDLCSTANEIIWHSVEPVMVVIKKIEK